MIRYPEYNRKMTWLLQQGKVEEFNDLRPPEKEMGREINLERVNFSGSCLAKANLYGANLRFANFSGTTLKDTIFRDTDLFSANFKDAIMIDTDMVGARVDHVDFSAIKIFQGVNISGMCGLSFEQQEFLLDSIKQGWNWNNNPKHISHIIAEIMKQRGF